MNAISIIQKKRDRNELTREEMSFFLKGYVAGDISQHQAAALVTSIFLNGLTDRELTDWTRAMIDTGTRLSFHELPQAKIDKHSTGGVGDKVSIPLAPAVAACGVAVPMISGRGLGHTGGTLDKLESIPGFRVRLSEAELHRCLDRTNVAFGAQTDDLVPADKKLYALRDAIGMVESVPLIASSIMSKKLAEGIEGLVLDVKFGSGAFKPDVEEGAELAKKMIALGRGMDVDVVAYQTAMDRPLGRAVGHALEIVESVECLAGGGPHDLRELVLLFGGEMLRMARVAPSVEDGKRRIADALDSGRALRVFQKVIEEQGGDPSIVLRRDKLPRASGVEPLKAWDEGVLDYVDVRAIGLAASELGGGRRDINDVIDPAVGLVLRAERGERVKRGQTLVEVHHTDGKGLAECEKLLRKGLVIGPEVAPSPLVLGRIES
ncbi:MAG: thymidine phosphorylase [Planctomycetes bacterium]|nr:thymidine phosphorylase [Planctomycetota bacterium]